MISKNTHVSLSQGYGTAYRQHNRYSENNISPTRLLHPDPAPTKILSIIFSTDVLLSTVKDRDLCAEMILDWDSVRGVEISWPCDVCS